MPNLSIKIIDYGQGNNISIADNVKVDPNKKLSISIKGNNNKIIISSGVELNNSLIQIVGSDCTLQIGSNCRFINCNLILDQSSSILIGARTVWSSGVLRAEHKSTIRVGADCMFSADIHVRTTDGHGIFDLTTKERVNFAADVVIENHVWLGHSVYVNKGTTIGTCSIIGMSSVATGKLDPYSIYAGVPAKKIKDGVTWSSGLTFDSIPLPYRSKT